MLDFASKDIGSTPIPATIKGWYTQKIISIILVVCLLAALTTSAGAVDIYSTTSEAEPLLKSSSPLAMFDGGISTAAVEPSDLDDFLMYGSYSVADYLSSLNQYLWGSTTPRNSGYSLLSNLTDLFSDFFESTGWYLRDDGTVTNVNYSNSIADLVRMGFRGLSVNIESVTSAIQALDISNYSSILSSIYSSVDGIESGLTSANTAIGGVVTAVNNVRTAVNNVVSGLSTVNSSVGTVNTSVNNVGSSIVDTVRSNLMIPSGTTILNSNGQPLTLSNATYIWYMLRLGFFAINNHLLTTSGSSYLSSSGVQGSLSSDTRFNNIFNSAILGLSANIKGSESDNVYASTLNDNNNTTTTVNSTGLGPLLNTQLSNIGENLGHLAYVFASDEDIKLREDSQPLLDTTDSFYDDSDSNVKVSANNVGSLKDIASNFTSVIDVDADIGDAFSIVSNSNTYRWFSADTAMNLDSLGVATVDFEESTYDRLHREFNEIYFPDRVGGAS